MLFYLYVALLVKRHSGVLGLAALIGACPYTVPDWLPDVIAEMALHQHDPAPLQVRLIRSGDLSIPMHFDVVPFQVACTNGIARKLLIWRNCRSSLLMLYVGTHQGEPLHATNVVCRHTSRGASSRY